MEARKINFLLILSLVSLVLVSILSQLYATYLSARVFLFF